MRRRRLVLLLAVVAVLAPLVALLFGEARVGRALERRAYDGWFTLRGSRPAPDDVVVVAIDLASVESLGRYPWSREWHTRLIRNLHRAGARVVAFDATFADRFPAQDSLLRRVVDSTGIAILGAKTESIFRRNARGFRLEEPSLELRGAPVGIVDIQSDPADGVIREYPILHTYPQRRVPQLGVQAVLHFLDLSPEALEATEDGWRLGERTIPRGPGGGMLVNFLGTPGSVSTYSYASVVDDAETEVGAWDMDVFEDLLAEGRFRDKIVLVGSTVPEHQDLHPTPFRDAEGTESAILTPGVEIHAHAVSTILSGSHIRRLSSTFQYAWTFLLGLLTIVVTTNLRGGWGAGAAAGVAAGALFASWHLFSAEGLWLWATTPLLSVGLSYAGTTATLFLVEEREKARIRGMFQQYVSASVVDELIEQPGLLALGGEERVASVLFTDIEGFSGISEGLTPTELVELLNEYLTAMTDIVIEHGGIIDKYQGDSIMAEFGVPVPQEDHALQACRAAVRMTGALSHLREEWAREGRPPLDARVGINTGRMLVGNLGSHRIMDYTVMGDQVNLASRLEGANKLYGTRIMASEFTWEVVKEKIVARELDRIRVKGKSEPVRVYEILGMVDDGVSEQARALLERFESALELYKSGCYGRALEAFEAVADEHPDDKPTHLYVERCREFVESPPPEDWDGVYTMTTK